METMKLYCCDKPMRHLQYHSFVCAQDPSHIVYLDILFKYKDDCYGCREMLLEHCYPSLYDQQHVEDFTVFAKMSTSKISHVEIKGFNPSMFDSSRNIPLVLTDKVKELVTVLASVEFKFEDGCFIVPSTQKLPDDSYNLALARYLLSMLFFDYNGLPLPLHGDQESFFSAQEAYLEYKNLNISDYQFNDAMYRSNGIVSFMDAINNQYNDIREGYDAYDEEDDY